MNQYLYRYIKNGTQMLNICPPEKVLFKSQYAKLYNALYNGIICEYLELQLKKLLLPCADQDDYNKLLAIVLAKFEIKLGDIEPRLVITEPDGTVIIDTYKVTLNTFANWKNKLINENHNTRMSIKNAQQLADGVGYEKKKSTTIDPIVQYSVAIRAGNKNENYGTLRLSSNVYCDDSKPKKLNK